MTFKEVLELLKDGFKVKRKDWDGYWVLNCGKVEMHCKDNVVVDMINGVDDIFTLSNIVENDWELATIENSPVYANELKLEGVVNNG